MLTRLRASSGPQRWNHALRLMTLSAVVVLMCASTALADIVTGRVIGITDGDSLTLLDSNQIPLKVRLAEIDAPERGQAWGTKSREMLSDLAYGKQARLEIAGKDRYGRIIARVHVGQTDVNAEMVRRGGAWAYRRYLTDPSILTLEAAARRSGAGLWSMPPGQTVAPWEWRANRQAASVVPPSTETQGYHVICGTKRYCRQMTSCAEAVAYMRQCRLAKLDGDGDGVPCESLCR